MRSNKRLWRWLAFIFVLSFGVLGYLGVQIYLTAPPIPKAATHTERWRPSSSTRSWAAPITAAGSGISWPGALGRERSGT